MRKIIDLQMKIGETAISSIQFDPKSRDEIPKLLRGLQAIYCNREVRAQVFEALTGLIPSHIDTKNGRKGMDLWKILVLGALRLSCNWDYDKLQEIANNHMTLRQMLGHGRMDAKYQYELQTLKDNISLFTPEILDKINQIVIKYGHKIAGKKKDEKLTGSCDSFVVETNVHYPTDINLLFDAIRKMIVLMMQLCGCLDISDWRQGKHHIRKAKQFYRSAQQLKRSSSKDESKKAEREQLIINAHNEYIDLAQFYIDKIRQTLITFQQVNILNYLKIEEIKSYIVHAERQIDQIRRRVVNDETILHHEKVFSLFEQHTEWISKGKAGVPVELGLRVCIVKDQYEFILHHRVMQNETDDKIAVSIIEETQSRFPDFKDCSFDKGFHSPYNQKELATLLDHVVLPRKGRLSAINKDIENSEEFKKARRKHSAVESSINALENHGLDRCPDHGIEGFKRYVALAVVARNLQILGNMLQQKEVKSLRRQEKKARKAA
ncbi:MAG: ISNCY family transposase [Desulfosalsimonadaceae bacterium]